MLATVTVKPRAEYESFIAERAANPASPALGKEEWEHVCLVCHRLDRTYIGPSLGDNPLMTHPVQLTNLLRNGGIADAGGRKRLVGRPDHRARRLLQGAEGREWLAPTPPPSAPTAPTGRKAA